MMDWSLSEILASLNEDIEQELERVRKVIGHPGSKGDASEDVWLRLFQKYLPNRYCTDKAHVVDSRDSFSDQIDAVVYDQQYSPFILNYGGQKVVPAESVYAAFEAKQKVDSNNIRYAQEKIASVRGLHRTSLPIPYADGTYPPKELNPIVGGVLALDSDWNPALSKPLREALNNAQDEGRLDMGCVAAHGYFYSEEGAYQLQSGGKPATAFLFRLMSTLQESATVPMIDIDAYADWL